MPAIVTNKFRFHNAVQFKEAFDEVANTVVYFYVGGPTAFNDDLNPPTPSSTTANIEFTPWTDMIGMKRVQPSDVSFVVPRHNWSSGTVYTQFDDKLTNILTNSFFVLTDDYNVYKCLFNNNGVASTTKPTGTSSSPITTADGYVWKFMYSVTTADALKFLTTNYVPVKKLTSNDGSPQWSVQSSAVDGAIHVIKVTAAGSGYTGTPTVTITGDGAGANATAVITANTVTAITVNSIGTGYTNATVSITGGSGSSAAATAILSPKGGHGADPVEELGGLFVLVNTRLDGTESSTFSVANQFRKIGLVRDPFTFGTSTSALGSVYRQTYRYTLTGTTGVFSIDETVTSGSNTATVVEYDSSNNYIYTTVPLPQAFANTAAISGNSSGAAATINGISTPGIQPYSGEILYVENRSPIQRAADQIEDVKLIVEF
jgi:hypothetical protein